MLLPAEGAGPETLLGSRAASSAALSFSFSMFFLFSFSLSLSLSCCCCCYLFLAHLLPLCFAFPLATFGSHSLPSKAAPFRFVLCVIHFIHSLFFPPLPPHSCLPFTFLSSALEGGFCVPLKFAFSSFTANFKCEL